MNESRNQSFEVIIQLCYIFHKHCLGSTQSSIKVLHQADNLLKLVSKTKVGFGLKTFNYTENDGHQRRLCNLENASDFIEVAGCKPMNVYTTFSFAKLYWRESVGEVDLCMKLKLFGCQAKPGLRVEYCKCHSWSAGKC